MNTSSNNTHHGKWRILFLFLCLFLLLASGRLDSGDANAELAGSVNLVQTGSLGTATPYSDEFIQSLFVHAPNGRYYEAHDIGNSLLLTPAAVGGSVASARLSRAASSTKLDSQSRLRTLISKTLASLIETATSAVACFYLFLLFGLFYKARPAFIMTAVFIFATFYTAYFRTGWDVLPACNAVIVLLYYSAKLILAPVIRVSDSVSVALMFGIVCIFRFSLAPFLGLGLLIMLWGVRKRIRRSAVVAAISTAVVMFIPTLIFNSIRTGSPLKSASTAPQFHYQTGLTGNLAKGMFGLLLSPNRGLFIYSPILLLLVLLPWYWKSMPTGLKSLLKAYLPPVFFYYLMIAKMLNWGAAGWGPRYLLPVLPILFLGTAAVAYQLWIESQAQRLLVVSLCSIALLLSLPTLLVDYSNATLQYPDAFSLTTPYPVQHIAVWKNLLAGLRGRPVQARANVGTDEESKLLMAFPDLLVTRAHQVLAGRSTVAARILVGLYVGALGCIAYLLWISVSRAEELTDNDGVLPGQAPPQGEEVSPDVNDPMWRKRGIVA